MDNRVFRQRVRLAKAMHEIICCMNNEGAYESWIYLMPDQPQEDDFEWFAEDDDNFRELVHKFIRLYNRYIKDGIYILGGNDVYDLNSAIKEFE